ncbi:hypothetical protein BX600DRAFT_473395 [Xylariales sp. PMI_506]|nr:hypothetical protein BX600DRAFT_473395 [Xylariales sp. PMI_506]
MTSEDLFVVKRIFTDLENPSIVAFKVALPATFTVLEKAKAEATTILTNEGYQPTFFEVYDVNDKSNEWNHDDGTKSRKIYNVL